CPGLQLEDLHLTDGLKVPIVLTDCAALKDQPITVERVRFTTVRDYYEGASLVKERNGPLVRPAALECTTTAPATGPHLLMRFCRIEGLFQAGVRVQGPGEVE